MTPTLESRVEDIESLIADLPQLFNLRFERVNASFSETNARLDLIDKQSAMLVRDLRDMRGGVTRQLVAQDERIAALAARLDQGLAALAARLDQGLGELNAKLDELLTRLPKT